jgi:hypothetical protein
MVSMPKCNIPYNFFRMFFALLFTLPHSHVSVPLQTECERGESLSTYLPNWSFVSNSLMAKANSGFHSFPNFKVGVIINPILLEWGQNLYGNLALAMI